MFGFGDARKSHYFGEGPVRINEVGVRMKNSIMVMHQVRIKLQER